MTKTVFANWINSCKNRQEMLEDCAEKNPQIAKRHYDESMLKMSEQLLTFGAATAASKTPGLAPRKPPKVIL